jgi:hypothetical protein
MRRSGAPGGFLSALSVAPAGNSGVLRLLPVFHPFLLRLSWIASNAFVQQRLQYLSGIKGGIVNRRCILSDIK